MTTAAEALMMRDEARDDNMLNQLFLAFISSYAPVDRYDRSEFEMRLHHLVRATYREAAKPYEKIMSAGLASMSVNSIFSQVKS